MDIQIVELENKMLKEQVRLLTEMNELLKDIVREKFAVKSSLPDKKMIDKFKKLTEI